MTTYLELIVPISFNESWFRDLRERLDGVNVRWQRNFYHITMVFVNHAPDGVNLVPGLNDILSGTMAPAITFDKLDAFTASGGHSHIINLTATEAPEEFQSLVQDLRDYLTSNGCTIQSGFRLHVTLGRVQDPRARLRTIKEAMSQVQLPAMTLDLTDVNYRIFKNYDKPLAHWQLTK